jgi:hypothetical protein
MLDSVTPAAGTLTVVNAGRGGVSVEDIQNYGKYIEVVRNLGRLKENEKPLVDLKSKTLVADNRILQWVPGAAMLQRHWWSGFDIRIIKDSFEFLRKCRKEACKGSSEHRVWGKEISTEFAKIGITKDFDYKKLKKAKDVTEIDQLFAEAQPEHQGLKRVLKYYFSHEKNGAKLRKYVAKMARQIHKMQMPSEAPVPIAPPLPTASLTSSRIARERQPSVLRPNEGAHGKENATGSRVFYGYTTDLNAIKSGRDSLRRNSVYVSDMPEKKSLNEIEDKNLRVLESESNSEIERQLNKVAVAQLAQGQVDHEQCARAMRESRVLLTAKMNRPPSIEDLDNWDQSWKQMEASSSTEIPRVPEKKQENRNKQFVVTKIGNSSVIVDERAMRKGIKKALRKKLRDIKAVNSSDNED